MNRQDRVQILTSPIAVLQPPSLIQNTLVHFELETIQDLLDVDLDAVASTRGVGRGKVEALAELVERARALSEGELELDDGTLPLATLLEELEAVGVDLDGPWQRALVRLDRRTRNVFEREELDTVRDVVVRHEAGSLLDLAGYGRTSHERLAALLDDIITRGFITHIYGERGAPASLSEAVAFFLSELEEPDLLMVRMRYFEAATLEQIGAAFDLSRERVRQRISSCLERGAQFLTPPLTELLADIIAHLDASGGLLARTRLQVSLPPEDVIIGLELLGVELRERARGFYTTLDAASFEQGTHALRERLASYASSRIPIEWAMECAREVAGWILDEDECTAFVDALWDIERDCDDFIHPWLDTSQRYAEILRDHGESMHLDQFGQTVQEGLGLEKVPSDRQLTATLTRADDVYHVDRGVYVHAQNLDLELDALHNLSVEAVEELLGETRAISTRVLLDTLRARGSSVPERVTPMLLRDVMSRDPRIQTFQSTDLVAHVESFSGTRRTQTNHVEDILLDTDDPLTCDEVCERMPDHISFNRDSVYMTLSAARFVVNLGQGRFLHEEAIGLTHRRREALVATAVSLLPRDRTPMSARALLEMLPSGPGRAFLCSHDEGHRILWGLLRRVSGVCAGGGGLVMLGEDGATPLLEAIRCLLKEQVLMTPSEIRRGLEERFQVELSHSPIYYVLDRAEENGVLLRVFEQWRSLAERTDDELVNEMQEWGAAPIPRTERDVQLERLWHKRAADALHVTQDQDTDT